MNRVWDHISFAICFAGFGYIALWLIGLGHIVLPPTLHAIGAAAAAFAPFYLLACVMRRRRGAACAMPVAPVRKPAKELRPPRRKATYPIRKVKPRNHFGLRGMPE
ncbi:MAG TPA: hypothetical protein VEF90_02180 [Xanthobacteraceae bacterium]|nr:hypothetical protein [Xanthobacteraceae bacterium]